MNSFTLAVFASPDLTELKIIYLHGGTARVRVSHQHPHHTQLVFDELVPDVGPSLVVVIQQAFRKFPQISTTGCFYDRNGKTYRDETFTPEHLQVAITRALAA